MTVQPKTSFQNGTIVTRAYLNSVQDAVTFNGQTKGNVLDPEYTALDNLNFANVGQRDGLKSFESLNDNSTAGSIGRSNWAGSVVGPNSVDLVPRVFTVGANFYVTVLGGSFQWIDGDIKYWNTQNVNISVGTTSYIYVNHNPLTNITSVVSASSLPSATTTRFVPLAKITTDFLGSIPTLSGNIFHDNGYVDLRPSTHLDSKIDESPTLLNIQTKNVDYNARVLERVLCDTSLGSFNITLPASPNDNDIVGVLDISGSFGLYPVTITSDAQAVNRELDSILQLNERFGSYTFTYSSEHSSWFLTESTSLSGQDTQYGSFLQCGIFLEPDTSTVVCVDGDVVVGYELEKNPPVYRKLNGICHKEWGANSAVYSAPSKPSRYVVSHNDIRCSTDGLKYTSGGSFGFPSSERNLRRAFAQTLESTFSAFEATVTTYSQSELDALYLVVKACARAIQYGGLSSVKKLVSVTRNMVTTTRYSPFKTYMVANSPSTFSLELNSLLTLIY